MSLSSRSRPHSTSAILRRSLCWARAPTCLCCSSGAVSPGVSREKSKNATRGDVNRGRGPDSSDSRRLQSSGSRRLQASTVLERREVARQLVEERRAASLCRPIGRVQAAGGAGEQRGRAAGRLDCSDSLSVAGPQAAHAVINNQRWRGLESLLLSL